MAKNTKKRLGRGLSALIGDEPQVNSAKEEGAKEVVGNIIELPIEKIKPNPNNPRTHFDRKGLEELAISIKELGIIQPITVRKGDEGYELISGERRFRASQIAGLESVPAFVRLADDNEMLEMALVENIQRQDLDAIEIALSYQRLIDEIGLTHDQLSKRVGKDRTSISNYLRLLKLDPIVQTGIRDAMISMGHGRALIPIDDGEEQLKVYERILKNNLSVRQTEELVKSMTEPNKAPRRASATELPNEFKKAQKYLEDSLHTKVEIKRAKNGKGRIVLSFTSDDDFERIKNKIL